MTMLKLGYRHHSQIGSHSQILLNQGNNIITINKCEIKLTLRDIAQSKYLSIMYNSHVHKITKIPTHLLTIKIL